MHDPLPPADWRTLHAPDEGAVHGVQKPTEASGGSPWAEGGMLPPAVSGRQRPAERAGACGESRMPRVRGRATYSYESELIISMVGCLFGCLCLFV